MSHTIGDMEPLIGRHFVTKGGNICVVKRLASGAARIVWSNKPSTVDMDELTAWVQLTLESMFSGQIVVGECRDPKQADVKLAEWQHRMKGD